MLRRVRVRWVCWIFLAGTFSISISIGGAKSHIKTKSLVIFVVFFLFGPHKVFTLHIDMFMYVNCEWNENHKRITLNAKEKYSMLRLSLINEHAIQIDFLFCFSLVYWKMVNRHWDEHLLVETKPTHTHRHTKNIIEHGIMNFGVQLVSVRLLWDLLFSSKILVYFFSRRR